MAYLGRDPVFVLIHSPLVGPTTWSPVAQELELRGRETMVPSLLGVADADAPQWRHVPEAVRAATARTSNPIILVGNSAGGLLLQTIADTVTVEISALVFVDSFLPPAGGSESLAPPDFMYQLRALVTDGVLPPWWSCWFGEDAMRKLIPEERLRAALVAEMPGCHSPTSRRACRCRRLGHAPLWLPPPQPRALQAKRHRCPWPRLAGGRDPRGPALGHGEPIEVTDALLDLEGALIGST